jgi:uncharacterized membrane protein
MALFSTVDLLALAWFLAAWLGYSFVIEMTPRGKAGLNSLMHRYRGLWMQRMLARDMRMMDGQVVEGFRRGAGLRASQSRAAVRGDELPGRLDETGYDRDE